VSNPHLANTHANQKEEKKMKDARGVIDLALMLNGENTTTQVEDPLLPQQNAATASKKPMEGRRQSKERNEEQKSTAHPQVLTKTPDATKKHEGVTLEETEKLKKEVSIC
jgi:hypothetical protein